MNPAANPALKNIVNIVGGVMLGNKFEGEHDLI